MHIYFPIYFHNHCMRHCEKLGGHSPSLKTFGEWQTFVDEVQRIKFVPGVLWLSATEGDKNGNLSRLDHWPRLRYAAG